MFIFLLFVVIVLVLIVRKDLADQIIRNACIGFSFPVVTFLMGAISYFLLFLSFNQFEYDLNHYLICCTLFGLPASIVFSRILSEKMKK